MLTMQTLRVHLLSRLAPDRTASSTPGNQLQTLSPPTPSSTFSVCECKRKHIFRQASLGRVGYGLGWARSRREGSRWDRTAV